MLMLVLIPVGGVSLLLLLIGGFVCDDLVMFDCMWCVGLCWVVVLGLMVIEVWLEVNLD
jgi:hypothetical protein